MIERLKYLYRAYRYKHKIDPNEINYIYKNLQPNDIAVDIGAHKGGYLYWMQKKVGKNGRVYAFEPQPKLHQYISKIIQVNNYSQVTLEHKGVSIQKGILELNIPMTKSGTSPGATIEKVNHQGDFKQVKVDVITLDEYFFNKNIFPSLIKIDVEGHEKAVLEGGIKLLKKCKPKIVMECENRHLNDGDVFDIFKILINIGYKGYFFENNQLIALEHFDIKKHQVQEDGRFWEAENYINNFVFE